MMNECNKFINWAKNNGWKVKENFEIKLELNDELINRYVKIPIEYKEFIGNVKQCISPNEKTWFICEDEYNDVSDFAFKWNEFEILSLEAAEGDEKWKAEITEWWNGYLPIVMSVENGYSFYAIDLKNNIGAILKGCEPEFEEVEKVAQTLDEFLELIMLEKIEL
ncbi:MAG: SMI1/KNR4 family protein [Clostridia bacterium]|nr:SMI1/KNR4 family protein [Clostridia bacterium]